VSEILLVLIFVSIDCPVSNRYAPDIQRLHHAFASKGVRFQLVYPNPSDNRAAIDRHLKDYGYPSIGVADPNHALVKTAQATITPEAAVFDKDRRLLYRGRIDDRFVELGRERPAATVHDLRNALAAALAGRAVIPSRTQAVGCFIADMVRSSIVDRPSSIVDRRSCSEVRPRALIHEKRGVNMWDRNLLARAVLGPPAKSNTGAHPWADSGRATEVSRADRAHADSPAPAALRPADAKTCPPIPRTAFSPPRPTPPR